MSVSDLPLIEAWVQGADRAALDELLRRYLGRIRSVVFQMVLDDATADDLTQDVCLRVIRSLSTYSRQAEFSTWLHRITLNVVYSHLERVQRGPQVADPARLQQERTGTSGPEQVVASVEAVATIEQALAELTPRQRGALVLTCLQGLSADMAAEIEGCEVNTIYARVHEARRKLKLSLGDLL